jgi:hemoglobin-like flavoprotein
VEDATKPTEQFTPARKSAGYVRGVIPAPMTPHEITLVQTSFAKVAPIAATAADLFYGRLFEIAPDVRAMFPDDMTDQKKKLMAMLGTAVASLTRLDQLLPVVHALGQRHAGYGVKAEHFAPVGAALLCTLEQGLGEAFTPEVKEAWAAVYGTLSAIMITAMEQTMARAA